MLLCSRSMYAQARNIEGQIVAATISAGAEKAFLPYNFGAHSVTIHYK